jgi:hypothetical protein
MVNVAAEGVPMHAGVDTEAEVSALSKRVYNELAPNLPIKKYVTMTQAGDSARMNSLLWDQWR